VDYQNRDRLLCRLTGRIRNDKYGFGLLFSSTLNTLSTSDFVQAIGEQLD